MFSVKFEKIVNYLSFYALQKTLIATAKFMKAVVLQPQTLYLLLRRTSFFNLILMENFTSKVSLRVHF